MINWADKDQGTELKSYSSAVNGCEARNLLDPSLNCIWLTEEGHKTPHWVTFHLSKPTPDLCLKTIGWHCWHSYNTNPKTVIIHVSEDGFKFKKWDTFNAISHHKGNQLFCCTPIKASIYPYITLEVTATFGSTQTYMNKLFLYSDEMMLDGDASSVNSSHRTLPTESVMSNTDQFTQSPLISKMSSEHVSTPLSQTLSNRPIPSIDSNQFNSTMNNQTTKQNSKFNNSLPGSPITSQLGVAVSNTNKTEKTTNNPGDFKPTVHSTTPTRQFVQPRDPITSPFLIASNMKPKAVSYSTSPSVTAAVSRSVMASAAKESVDNSPKSLTPSRQQSQSGDGLSDASQAMIEKTVQRLISKYVQTAPVPGQTPPRSLSQSPSRTTAQTQTLAQTQTQTQVRSQSASRSVYKEPVVSKEQLSELKPFPNNPLPSEDIASISSTVKARQAIEATRASIARMESVTDKSVTTSSNLPIKDTHNTFTIPNPNPNPKLNKSVYPTSSTNTNKSQRRMNYSGLKELDKMQSIQTKESSIPRFTEPSKIIRSGLNDKSNSLNVSKGQYNNHSYKETSPRSKHASSLYVSELYQQHSANKYRNNESRKAPTPVRVSVSAPSVPVLAPTPASRYLDGVRNPFSRSVPVSLSKSTYKSHNDGNNQYHHKISDHPNNNRHHPARHNNNNNNTLRSPNSPKYQYTDTYDSEYEDNIGVNANSNDHHHHHLSELRRRDSSNREVHNSNRRRVIDALNTNHDDDNYEYDDDNDDYGKYHNEESTQYEYNGNKYHYNDDANTFNNTPYLSPHRSPLYTHPAPTHITDKRSNYLPHSPNPPINPSISPHHHIRTDSDPHIVYPEVSSPLDERTTREIMIIAESLRAKVYQRVIYEAKLSILESIEV